MSLLFTEPVPCAFQYELSSYMPVTLGKGRLLRKTPSPQLTEWGSSSLDSQFPILGSIWLSNFQGNVSSGWPNNLLQSAEHVGQLPYCLIHFCEVLTQTPRNGNLDVMRSYWTHVRKICTICCDWHLVLVSQGGDSWMIMPLTCFFPHHKAEKPSKTGKLLAKHHSHLLYGWFFLFIFQTARMFCTLCCTIEELKMTLSSKSFQIKNSHRKMD